MAYSVIFAIDLATIPEDACGEIEKEFQQIAEVVATIPEWSPFFSSVRDSVLQIDVQGWRLGYHLDPPRRELRVIEATRLPG